MVSIKKGKRIFLLLNLAKIWPIGRCERLIKSNLALDFIPILNERPRITFATRCLKIVAELQDDRDVRTRDLRQVSGRCFYRFRRNSRSRGNLRLKISHENFYFRGTERHLNDISGRNIKSLRINRTLRSRDSRDTRRLADMYIYIYIRVRLVAAICLVSRNWSNFNLWQFENNHRVLDIRCRIYSLLK